MSVSKKWSLEFDPKRDELPNIVAEVERAGEQNGWSLGLIFRINLIMEEMMLNIIDYGFDDRNHQIDVTFISEDNLLTIEIIDDGRPFDPLSEAPAPDIDASLEDRRIGGLGIHLVRTMTEDMRYECADGKNHLTLVTRTDI